MWADNETERDYLNFSSVSDTVAQIIVQAEGRPISIGVSGAWGSGKSSMIKLIQASLSSNSPKNIDRRFVCVEFNAWLYQGYDDARAALLDVIANELVELATEDGKVLSTASTLLERVNWLRVTKFLAGFAVPITMGLPPVGLFGQFLESTRRMLAGETTGFLKDAGQQQASTKKDTDATELLNRKETDSSPPKEIQALRDTFEQTLEELGVTLVVLVDDLDRCLPDTTISTLEAIRLFLFLQNTAFVIAADTDVLKLAVRRHFSDDDISQDDRLVTSYFDKLVQVPIQVPPLGIQEVRAYMMLLYIEDSSLDEEQKEDIRKNVCIQLSQTWQGNPVDRTFVDSLDEKSQVELTARFDTVDRLAPLMTQASGVIGNPRLIKRFLNALSIRTTIADVQGVAIDEAVLAKLLLLERHGGARVFSELIRQIGIDSEGKPRFLAKWEEQALAGEEPGVTKEFEDPFFKNWLSLPPTLFDTDLRGAIYVSREHASPTTAVDALSSLGTELLKALLQHPRSAASQKEQLSGLMATERAAIMDRLLDDARLQETWGVPDVLEACIVLAEVDLIQGKRLAGFLSERPPAQIRPNIVPKIADQTWSSTVFDNWYNETATSRYVKTAITKIRKVGNISV